MFINSVLFIPCIKNYGMRRKSVLERKDFCFWLLVFLQLCVSFTGLFAQYCNFLHQSGYTERAVSSYQTLIEFNLFCPSYLNLSTSKERLKQFEEFMDSYAPRFGERNAKGWARWTENRNGGHDAASVSGDLFMILAC